MSNLLEEGRKRVYFIERQHEREFLAVTPSESRTVDSVSHHLLHSLGSCCVLHHQARNRLSARI